MSSSCHPRVFVFRLIRKRSGNKIKIFADRFHSFCYRCHNEFWQSYRQKNIGKNFQTAIHIGQCMKNREPLTFCHQLKQLFPKSNEIGNGHKTVSSCHSVQSAPVATRPDQLMTQNYQNGSGYFYLFLCSRHKQNAKRSRISKKSFRQISCAAGTSAQAFQ